ncbi:hypothetical protein HU200_022777 [Digitaria exilis]|uniref:TF-B3 domain-containing protein n=1 Tax=Digitaria exilis TaxID=1010633 RepID=A0A835CA90_9POAL|nr:hypothetical protein HU200_022777 [Digitaria exilis]
MRPMGNSKNEGLVMNREDVVLGSTGSSCSTAELGNTVFEQNGGTSDRMKNSIANHDNEINEHASVGCKNTEVKSASAKENKTVVGADKNKYPSAGSVRSSTNKFEVHGDSNNNIIDSLMPEREKEEIRFQPDCRDIYVLPQRNMAATVSQLSTMQNDAVDKVMPHSPNGSCEEVLPYPGIKSIPTVRERSVDSVDTSSTSQHGTTEASENSERFTKCQKGGSHRRGKTSKMVSASSSSDESGEYIPSENVYLESDALKSPLGADYVLSYRTYLSEEQKKKVMMLIQEIQPDFTVYIATMRKTTVQPPGPYLGITKEYALAYFPDKTTKVTLEMPGKSKKWHPKFYKEDKSRKNFLMGQWLDFVRDNHVQEGDIVVLSPTKDGKRSIFAVYLLHETAINSRGGSGAKLASQVHIEEELTTGTIAKH